ncbi:MAG: putative CRISPR-associated protein [Stellaceae bacterium]
MRLIVSTTGTSIARGITPLANERDLARYRDDIRKRCDAASTREPEKFLVTISAETNSLARLGVSPADQIVLLHSDTLDGKVCASEVAELLRSSFGIANPVLERVEGLQVNDATRFRSHGIRSLFRHLDDYAEMVGEDGPILLNITGGFKSVVPYVTLYGMLRGQRVVYLFEQSSELISLPLAPLSFDWDRLARAANALTALKRQQIMSEAEFNARLPDLGAGDREWYGCLVEQIDGLLAPSAFGEMVYAAIDAAVSTPVFISSEADAAFKQSKGAVREQYAFILSRIANPLLRRMHLHGVSNSDLLYWKPGNTAERVGYFLKDRNIYVCELNRHGYPGHNRKDFPIDGFTRFRLPADGVAETEEELAQSWKDRLDRAESERLAANALVDEANESREQADRARDAARHELEASHAAAERLRGELAVSGAELAAARAELAERRRPWWQRLARMTARTGSRAA